MNILGMGNSYVKPKLSDFVAAYLWQFEELHGCVTYTGSSNDEKRRLKPAATIAYNIKSLNLGSIVPF